MYVTYGVQSRVSPDVKWVKSRNCGLGCIFYRLAMNRDDEVVYARILFDRRYKMLQNKVQNIAPITRIKTKYSGIILFGKYKNTFPFRTLFHQTRFHMNEISNRLNDQTAKNIKCTSNQSYSALLPKLTRLGSIVMLSSTSPDFCLFVATYSIQSLKHLKYLCAMHSNQLRALVCRQLRA